MKTKLSVVLGLLLAACSAGEDVDSSQEINQVDEALGEVCKVGGPTDPDKDGICGSADNCPDKANADQKDSDKDGKGDVCDACPLDAANDADKDGVCGNVDNCPTKSNADQKDTDKDGKGDACDACPLDRADDSDKDGVCDGVDNCPAKANADQKDGDKDGKGDVCDACPLDAANDADKDGICGNVDNCPTKANADQKDSDKDGIGDACDPDSDNDGVDDPDDTCPGTVHGPTNAQGCSVDQLCPCAGPWKNHGQYVSCVAHATNEMVTQGRITEAQKGAIQSAAGQSSCGKK